MPARRAAAQSAERRGLPRARAVRVGCLTGDRALRERGEEALLEFEQRLPQLPDGQAGDLQTVLFHARYVLREQIAIDADLREIRALDVPMRHQGALAAYGTIQRRAARTRLLLGAVCQYRTLVETTSAVPDGCLAQQGPDGEVVHAQVHSSWLTILAP